MTNSDLDRERPVMMSSTMPSAKYSCSGSELRLVNGRTAQRRFVGKCEDRFRRLPLDVGDRRGGGAMSFLHRTDEAIAPPRQRLDQPLFLPGIANRGSSGIQPGRQRDIRHAPPLPNGCDELVLANDALAVANKIVEQVKGLWRQGDDVCVAVQFAAVGIQFVVFEEIAQDAKSLWAVSGQARQHLEKSKNKVSVRKM